MKEVDGCLGLKTIIEYNDYYIIREAVKVEKRRVKLEEFSLPTDKIIVAKGSALDDKVKLDPPSQDQVNCYVAKIKKAVIESQISEPYTCYLSFIITKKGEMKHLRAFEEDEYGFHKVAIDIIESCNINFVPGQIDDYPVSAFTYFPITFE